MEIHPFNHGNGRTARLLMNLILIRRVRYIGALQQAQAGSAESMFLTVLYERLDATLDDYLQVLTDPQSQPA